MPYVEKERCSKSSIQSVANQEELWASPVKQILYTNTFCVLFCNLRDNLNYIKIVSLDLDKKKPLYIFLHSLPQILILTTVLSSPCQWLSV